MTEDPLSAIALDTQLAGRDIAEITELAREAENRGFDRLWAPELYRSATVPLAAAATGTQRIGLATGIALAFTRSPLVMALEALDLDELSQGRAVLGLGAGARRLNREWHAVDYDPPVARMRELVAALREVFAALHERRDARSSGRLVDISIRGFRRESTGPRPGVPIWLAAVRPGMAGLAGEAADGFLDHPVTSPDWLEERLRPAIAAGAARADRSPPSIAAAAICAVDDDDPERARRAAALTVGFSATVTPYAEVFEMHGFGARLPGIRRAFMDGGGVALVDAFGPEMTDRFSIHGTSTAVRSAAAERGRGVDRLWLTVPHHQQSAAEMSAWQRSLLRACER